MTTVADILSEYVNEDGVVEEARNDPQPAASNPDGKNRKRRRRKEEEAPGGKEPCLHPDPVYEAELTRKRDILASVALLEGLESYAGEKISAVDVRKMKEKDLICLFRVYEEKSGQELIRDSLSIAAEGVTRGLSFLLSFDDREALKEDLRKNKHLGRFIARYASRISEDYGDVVALLRLGFDIAKHVVLESSNPHPQPELQESA